MQKNKKLILLTYDFPFGRSEKTFLSYELLKLSENDLREYIKEY